jgi:hypothetical protein
LPEYIERHSVFLESPKAMQITEALKPFGIPGTPSADRFFRSLCTDRQ